MSMPTEHVAVLGAGVMGHGIAQVAAVSGMTVTLFDVHDGALLRGMENIRQTLSKSISLGKLTEDERTAALARLRASAKLADAVRDAAWIIEAIPEVPAIKTALWRDVNDHASDTAILATNTSSLSVTELAAHCTDPSRFLGMHFFNPPHVAKLLELVRGEHTSEATLTRAHAFAKALGRDVIEVRDTPGFATSRLGLVLGLEAMRMLQEGVACATDIDRAMEQGYRHPMGPLRLTDLIGLDTRLAIADYLHRELGGEQFRAPAILRRMVRAGKLGKKTGEGFYRW